ncbi:MAG: transaldolase [Vicinamibacterales bacterium]
MSVTTASDLASLRVKVFADGADLDEIARLAANPLIRGFTTNPTLMRKAGVPDYRAFASEALPLVTGRPISFEVFSDELDEMERQAHEIASWGANVFVKIPVTNTEGVFSGPLVKRLVDAGVRVNVTAVLTAEQVGRVAECLSAGVPSFVSIFAGRIADTGRDPMPVIAEALGLLRDNRTAELIWASPRELLNLFQASEVGCHVITATADILGKLPLVGKSLETVSLETVRMFRRDAVEAGYTIDVLRRTV